MTTHSNQNITSFCDIHHSEYNNIDYTNFFLGCIWYLLDGHNGRILDGHEIHHYLNNKIQYVKLRRFDSVMCLYLGVSVCKCSIELHRIGTWTHGPQNVLITPKNDPCYQKNHKFPDLHHPEYNNPDYKNLFLSSYFLDCHYGWVWDGYKGFISPSLHRWYNIVMPKQEIISLFIGL